MRRLYITGIAGTGKTAIANELTSMGYTAYSIEDIPGLFTMLRKNDGKPFDNFNNNDFELVKQGDWICDREKLIALLNSQKDEIAFYSGVARNNDEIIGLFDRTILLQAPEDTLRKRLSIRKPGEFGNSKEVRDWVLSYQKWFDDALLEQGAVAIASDGDIGKTTKKIIESST